MRCPSQDWDYYSREQDEQIAHEIHWWKENKDRVLQVICADISNPNGRYSKGESIKMLIDNAKSIVENVMSNTEDI